jgi:hypothetical protein
MRFGVVALVLGALLSSGCAEQVLFKSTPSSAKVFVSDGYVGDTPTVFSTRDVIIRPYRIELSGFPAVQGALIPHLAAGRVAGAVFTLGILALIRPMYYYTDGPIDVLICSTVKLYDLSANEVATGICDANGRCAVTFPNGMQCSGATVRANEGTTSVPPGASDGSVDPDAASGAAASTGRQVQNSQRGVAMFQCPDSLIDCSLTLDAFGPTGFGDCTNARGDRFRLMFLAFTGQ